MGGSLYNYLAEPPCCISLGSVYVTRGLVCVRLPLRLCYVSGVGVEVREALLELPLSVRQGSWCVRGGLLQKTQRLGTPTPIHLHMCAHTPFRDLGLQEERQEACPEPL